MMEQELPESIENARIAIAEEPALYEPGFSYADPSNIVSIDDMYHVWYVRWAWHGTEPAQGESPVAANKNEWNALRRTPNRIDIRLAVSPDGHTWEDKGSVIKPSRKGVWHEFARHAPHAVESGGRHYLMFTAFFGDYSDEGLTGEKHIGIAVSDNPAGPFEHIGDGPVFSPSPEDGAFDHYLVDDPCVIRRNGKLWMYYKGRPQKIGGQCWLGLAEAETITGPWKRVQSAPVCELDWHTACVWPHDRGLAGMVDGNCIAYSGDGLRFKAGAKLHREISDTGVCCPAALQDDETTRELPWGIGMIVDSRLVGKLHRFDLPRA